MKVDIKVHFLTCLKLNYTHIVSDQNVNNKSLKKAQLIINKSFCPVYSLLTPLKLS